jgi:poly(3-hydroxybutyrate) depolymerase
MSHPLALALREMTVHSEVLRTRPIACRIALTVVAAAWVSACAGHLTVQPDVFEAETVTVVDGNISVDLVLVKPTAPTAPSTLVVFASGDGGLRGVSMSVLQHLADRGGCYVAGYNSRDPMTEVRTSGGRVPYARAVTRIGWITRQAKEKLGLPSATPVIVTGMSRGANMVILAAADRTLQKEIVGAVAIALTREMDYVEIPAGAERLPGVKVDDERRVQTYPAVQRVGSIPLAVIQSTNDSYVRSAESRQLLGPDTSTRRLYEIKSHGHSFGGGEAEMLQALDDALNWIANRR